MQQVLERLVGRVVDVQIGEQTRKAVGSNRGVSVLLTPRGTEEFVWVALTPALRSRVRELVRDAGEVLGDEFEFWLNESGQIVQFNRPSPREG